MEIRRARIEDAPTIAALLAELGYPASDAEVEDRLDHLDGSDCVLIAPGGLIAQHRVPRLPREMRLPASQRWWWPPTGAAKASLALC